MTTRLTHECEQCHGTGHSEHGMWDCDKCSGTGIGDAEVRNACYILTAAAKGISLADVSSADVYRVWKEIL